LTIQTAERGAKLTISQTTITENKQRITDRLARIDVEREKLMAELGEFETAERVFARYGGTKQVATGAGKRRGRPAKTKTGEAPMQSDATKTSRRARKPAAAKSGSPTGLSLAAATLQAVAGYPMGANSAQILNSLKALGFTPRPNHLGIALQRHKRAGRLRQEGGLWVHPGGMQQTG
jgi:hypothetical protein